MSTVTIEEARRDLDGLLRKLSEEQEIVITDGNKPLARIIPAQRPSVLDFKPRSVGKLLRSSPHSDDDILGEMLDNKFDPNK
jgi:prevent-host-death family protein